MKQSRVGMFVLSSCLALTGCGVGEIAGEDDLVSDTSQELSKSDCPASVPANLKPAANQTLVFKLLGVGSQVYTCTANAAGGYSWVFKEPVATLKESFSGETVGTHYVGPTWEDKWKHSTVVAAKAAEAPAPVAGAVPWLLLTAKSHAAAKGIFTEISSIQRLSTGGGVAPTSGCDATTVGQLANVPYQADYFFYKTVKSGTVFQCGQTKK